MTSSRDTSSRRTSPGGGTLALVLGGLTAVGPMTTDIYLPALPAIAADFGVGRLPVQLTLTAGFIGLGIGQLLAGPLSDRYGRRLPLLFGTVAYVVTSVGCALAPTIDILVACRLGQGMGGAVGIVVSRAVVRDVYSGARAVAFFSRLLLLFGIAPIVAPLLGAGILQVASWRVVFLILSLLGLVMFGAVSLLLPETLPPALRTTGGIRSTVSTARSLLTSRAFVPYAVACSLAWGGLFSYLATFPFIVQELYDRSALVYGMLFALNAAGLTVTSQLNHWFAERAPARTLLAVGLAGFTGGSVATLLCAVFDPPGGGGPGLAGLSAGLFLVIASLGSILPNATALLLESFPAVTGTASALLGGMQFLLGAGIVPLVGLGGPGSAAPLGIALALLSCAALLAFGAARKGPAPRLRASVTPAG